MNQDNKISEKNSTILNVPYIAVDTYNKGRPVEIGHISIKLKRDMLVKLCWFTGGPCGDISYTTPLKIFGSDNSFMIVL